VAEYIFMINEDKVVGDGLLAIGWCNVIC